MAAESEASRPAWPSLVALCCIAPSRSARACNKKVATALRELTRRRKMNARMCIVYRDSIQYVVTCTFNQQPADSTHHSFVCDVALSSPRRETAVPGGASRRP